MAKRVPEGPQLEVKVSVDQRRVLDLLCNGYEQGIGYWARIEKVCVGKGYKREQFAKGGKHNLCEYMDYFEHAPFFGDGYVLIEEHYDQPRNKKGPMFKLDREAIMRGLTVMANDWPFHFNDWMSEKDDAITADVFIQCCIFGDIKYS